VRGAAEVHKLLSPKGDQDFHELGLLLAVLAVQDALPNPHSVISHITCLNRIRLIN
jgi:hypothetical protein